MDRYLLDVPRRDLKRLLATGHAIDPDQLDGWEYKGISLGLPAWVERLSWKVFVKTFVRDAAGELRGWNVRIVQKGPMRDLADGPVEPMRKAGLPLTFGHYAVRPLAGYRVPGQVGAGLMIDYALGPHDLLDPMARMKDPLVALTPGSADRLLGWSYLDLGWLRVPTPSFFLLERLRKITHTP